MRGAGSSALLSSASDAGRLRAGASFRDMIGWHSPLQTVVFSIKSLQIGSLKRVLLNVAFSAPNSKTTHHFATVRIAILSLDYLPVAMHGFVWQCSLQRPPLLQTKQTPSPGLDFITR